jgi:hypothetical protein
MEHKKRTPRPAPTPPRKTPDAGMADEGGYPSEQTRQEYRDQQMRERESKAPTTRSTMGEGKLRLFRAGGAVSASRRADGIAQRGKTRGKMI